MSREASRDPALQELLDKQAIQEVLLRYCRGVDRRDEDLLRSVYHADAVHEYGEYAMNGREFAGVIVESIGRFAATSHFLSNVSTEVLGDVAHAESYVLACHRKEESGEKSDLTLALRYVDRLERRDGVWAIVHRVTLHDWSREDPLEWEWPDARGMIQGLRSREDRSYLR
jgi:hypothetical protein